MEHYEEVRIIPGYRQDHLGRTYQIVIGANGVQVQMFVKPPALSERLQAGLEKVTVESQARRGETFESMVCFQSVRA
jgi:hypothetical protein